MDLCTIVSRHELARARVLVSTLREHHPDAQANVTVLLLDGAPGEVEVAGANVRALEEVGLPSAGLLLAGNPRGAMALAALPSLLRQLLDEGSTEVIYLDAGLRVLGALTELQELAGKHALVLVARALIEQTRERPMFDGQLGGGALSQRVLAVKDGRECRRMLDSWPRWFRDGGPALAAWIDGLPVLGSDVGVLRDATYGLDPWTQLPARAQARSDVLEVDGRPARLFDFSELDPLEPDRLFDGEDTIALSEAPALAALCERHALELRAAGYDEDAKRPDKLESVGDGVSMTDTLRALLVEAVDSGELSLSPFSDDGRRAFLDHLNEPGDRGRELGLTRLHLAIWHSDPALQAAYPHLDGPDGEGFAGWLCVYGPQQQGLGAPLLPPVPSHVRREGPASPDEREPLWGVNVAGFFTSELGLGEAARLLIAGLDASGVPALPVQAQLVPPCRQDAEFTYADPDAAPYPISIVCMNGDSIAPFAREVGQSFFDGRYTIALWWWEVGEFPEGWQTAFDHIDEVWVASRHIYDAIAPASPVPVVQVGMPVIAPRVAPRTRAELGLPDGFLFLFVHDYHSSAARKNPVGLVEAFKRAFPPGSGAKLVVKSINAPNLPHQHDRVVRAAGEHPDITLIDSYVSAADKNAMIDACDCYVSLHRSEGFGLTVAEAMLLSKPVIATRYGGTLEFTNEANSYLVDWQPVKVGEDAHPYPADGVWADPDLDQAAALMREVYADPELARERGRLARREMIERHSPRAAGESLRARLRTVYDRRVQNGETALNPAHLPALDLGELPGLLASSPRIEASGLGARLRLSLKRRVVALMAPFRLRQQRIDEVLTETLTRLDARLPEIAQTLEHRQEARFAESLAMVRKLRSELADTRAELAGARTGLGGALQREARELELHLAEHRAQPYLSDELVLEQWSDPLAGEVRGYRSASGVSLGDRSYLDFENVFRGPEERVREIQRAYLPLLVEHAPVLDVGCGRGELLDMLRERGVTAGGVDLDLGMVELARAKGHDVALDDGVTHLLALEEGSLGAITALEVVEHIPYDALLEFLSLARSRLREDGLLVLETVNPHAVQAMKAFWVDLTHQHPIFPEVLLELCRLSGFAEAFWFHPTGTDEFEVDRNGQPVYAVVARRRAI